MKKIIFLISISLMNFTFIHSQTKDSALVRPYFFVSGNVDLNLIGKVMPSSAFRINLGFNIARFFTKKIVLGVFMEFSLYASNKKYSYLTNEINANLITTYDNSGDYKRSIVLSNVYNRNEFSSTGSTYVGLAFSPFPDKYGKILLLISKGYTYYNFGGKFDDIEENYSGSLDIPKLFNSSLIFKPLTLTKMKDKNFLKDHFQLGFYIQNISLKNATFTNRPLSTYLNPNFFSGNKNSEWQFGLRLGIGLGFVDSFRR